MSGTTLILGLCLVLANAFFVAAEYALVGSRRSRIESGAKKGKVLDKLVLRAMDLQTRYVAGVQIMITVLGIAMGALIEPQLSQWINSLFPDSVPSWVGTASSYIVMAYALVVVGELVPKYLALAYPETVARFVIRVLDLVALVLSPLIWLFQKSGEVLFGGLRKMGLKVEAEDPSMMRDELYFMIRNSQDTGDLESNQADMVTKALRLDSLDAEDAMSHRLDIHYLDVSWSKEEVLEQLKHLSHSRYPVCENGDLDEIVGIIYLQDLVRHIGDEDFDLATIARPMVFVPESLTLDRLVVIMREQKTQIVIVQDEYGGTSGLATLEDIVEEIFGDLEDAIESERPAIERTGLSRLSAKADVRYDELLGFLELESSDEEKWTTEPLAGILMDELGRTPKIGDKVDVGVGQLRVDSVAKRRVTRVGVYLKEELVQPAS